MSVVVVFFCFASPVEISAKSTHISFCPDPRGLAKAILINPLSLVDICHTKSRSRWLMAFPAPWCDESPARAKSENLDFQWELILDNTLKETCA